VIDDLKKALKALTEYFSHREEVLFAYVHGSVLERPNPNDVDVAVYVRGSLVPREQALDYELRQSVLLNRVVGGEADLKVLNYSPAAFAYHATAGILVFCRDEEARYAFLENTWREYFDYLPYIRQYLRDILNQ